MASYIQNIASKKSTIIWLKSNLFYFAYIGLWLLSLFFEANGERAGEVKSVDSNKISILDASLTLIRSLAQVNKFLVLYVMIIVMLFIYTMFRMRKKSINWREIQYLIMLLACSLLSAAYSILLCYTSFPSYISREDVLFNTCFYILAFISILFSVTLKGLRESNISLIVLLMMVLMGIQTINTTKSYKEYNMWNLPAETCKEISDDIINQIILADKNHESLILLIKI